MSQGFESSIVGGVALVVGASRGIGQAVAAALADDGAHVVLIARGRTALEEATASISASGGSAEYAVVDIRDDTAVGGVVERLVRRLGRVDVLVECAGVSPLPAPITEIPSEDFRDAVATNLVGAFSMMQHTIPAMVRSGGGSVITISSGAATRPVSGFAAYVATKAALNAMSQTAALDLAEHHVRVNVIAPGPVLTEHLAAADDESREQAAAAVPMGRVGTPADVVAAVRYLVSPAAAFVTGVVLPVDGGQLAGQKLRKVYRRDLGTVVDP